LIIIKKFDRHERTPVGPAGQTITVRMYEIHRVIGAYHLDAT
jgi:hypothetical protein